MDNKIITLRTSHLILAGLGASERLGQDAKGIGTKKLLLSRIKALSTLEQGRR
jgi:hypothetical protein